MSNFEKVQGMATEGEDDLEIKEICRSGKQKEDTHIAITGFQKF
jgi:hypothetical protein